MSVAIRALHSVGAFSILALAIACSESDSSSPAAGGHDAGGNPSGGTGGVGGTGGPGGGGSSPTACNSMFAARLASDVRVTNCGDTVATWPSSGVAAACNVEPTPETPNDCAAHLWDSPPSASAGEPDFDPADGALDRHWGPKCVDGTNSCAIDSPDALRCVDGTRVPYWLVRGQDSQGEALSTAAQTRWFIRLHSPTVVDGPPTDASTISGGCYFTDTCAVPVTGITAGAHIDASGFGLFSTNHEDNAEFRDFNKVFFKDVCFADNYLGDSSTLSATSPGGMSFPYTYRGGRVVEAVLQQLALAPPGDVASTRDATHIVIYGWSGGGRVPINLIDRLAHDEDENGTNGHDGGLIAQRVAADADSPPVIVGVVDARFQPGIEAHRAFAARDTTDDDDGLRTGDDVSLTAMATASLWDHHADYAADPVPLITLPDHDDTPDPDCDDEENTCPTYAPFDKQRKWNVDGQMRSLGTHRYRPGDLSGAVSFHDMLSGWQALLDRSCMAQHASSDPDACFDWMHVLQDHVASPLFVRANLHDSAYRSPNKLPSYTPDSGYYLSPWLMRERVRFQLLQLDLFFATESAIATGLDPSCSGGCDGLTRGYFGVDSWLHTDAVQSPQQAWHHHLRRNGNVLTYAQTLRAFVDAPSGVRIVESLPDTDNPERELLGTPGGSQCSRRVAVGGGFVDCWCEPDHTACAGCVDGDGDGLIACHDPDWGYAISFGAQPGDPARYEVGVTHVDHGQAWDVTYARNEAICRQAHGPNQGQGCWPDDSY